MSPADDDAALRASIAAIWDRGRERVLGRVDAIQDALEALRAGTLGDEVRAEARSDAHKLAGALGSFGMPDGTDHARAIEGALEDGAGPAEADDLARHAAALRDIVVRGPAR
jgi:HPt (histidine-containing phosphotransfer) domain-containing protein